MSASNRLNRAIERFDLREYVQEHFMDIRDAAGGEEMRVNCFSPDGCAGIDDVNHKLYINPDKKRWICFKCGYGKRDVQPGTGSLIRFMADVESKHPVQIRARLLEMTEPTPAEEFEDVLRMAFEPEPSDELEPRYLTLPRCFMKLRDTGTSRVSKAYLAFAQERGLKAKDLEVWDLRFCPTVPPAQVKKHGYWKGRLVFPIYDQEGKLRSAVGKALPSRVDKTPWVNWPETDIGDLLWPMGTIEGARWFPIPRTLTSRVVLVEGIFDSMAIWCYSPKAMEAPLPCPLCTFGKKISDGQIELLHELGVKKVTLAWDKDAKTEIQAAAEKLQSEFDTVLVFPFNDPRWEKHDLGDTLRGRVPPELIEQELNAAIDVQSNEFIAWLFQ